MPKRHQACLRYANNSTPNSLESLAAARRDEVIAARRLVEIFNAKRLPLSSQDKRDLAAATKIVDEWDFDQEQHDLMLRIMNAETTGKSAKADQNPIFRAASQLAAGYLGLIDRRHREFKQSRPSPKHPTERYVPLLVTNAELAVVDADAGIIDLATGTVAYHQRPKSPILLF